MKVLKVHLVYLMNVEELKVAVDSQTNSTEL